MKIVVDTNIVFSALLNSTGKIAHLIINGSSHFKYYSINLLKEEISAHKSKLLMLSGLSEESYNKSYNSIIARIKFINEFLLPENIVESANLVYDIDENDSLFIALNDYLGGKLWTGDKKLINGLRKKDYKQILDTFELYKIFNTYKFLVEVLRYDYSTHSLR